jgi:hypothetical protein
MRLESGYRFRGAPRFHRAFRWADRLCVNGGVDPSDPALPPRPDWRAATAEELALLADDTDSPPEVSDATDALQTFSLPRHILSRWLEVAGGLAGGPAGEPPGYRQFARDVASLLTFKGLPLPPRCAFDVVLAPASAPPPPGSRPSAADGPRVVALVSLGDAPTSLAFLNLPPPRLAALLPDSTADPGADVARRFLAAFPDYPLVRLTLGPGEGVWLPPAGGAFRHCPAEGLEVWLVLRQECAG